MLAPPSGEESTAEQEIPATAQYAEFEEGIVHVVMPESIMPSSLLVYKVYLLCPNKNTMKLVEMHKPQFHNLITDAHLGLRHEDLRDDTIKDTTKKMIVKEIVRKGNAILKRAQGNRDNKDVYIQDVLHEKFMMQDQG